MNFETTDEQRMLRESTDRLVRERYTFQQRSSCFTMPVDGLKEEWAPFAELGLPGLLIPEVYGGMGLDFDAAIPVLESLGGGVVFESFLATAVLGAGLLAASGSEAQCRAILPGVADGQTRLAVAHCEAQGRYRLDFIRTSARPTNDGFTLSGKKVLVLGGNEAQHYLVAARTSGDEADKDGISLFLLDREAPGLTVAPYRHLDLSGGADLLLEDVAVSRDALVGSLGGALPLLEWAIDRATSALCSEAVGSLDTLIALTLEHLRTREAFGKALGAFQVLQHRAVDMVVAAEQARSMALLAARYAEGPADAARIRAISGAKVQMSKSLRLVGQQAMQIFGAMAITEECPVGYFHKRLTVADHLFGDREYHVRRYAEASGY